MVSQSGIGVWSCVLQYTEHNRNSRPMASSSGRNRSACLRWLRCLPVLCFAIPRYVAHLRPGVGTIGSPNPHQLQHADVSAAASVDGLIPAGPRPVPRCPLISHTAARPPSSACVMFPLPTYRGDKNACFIASIAISPPFGEKYTVSDGWCNRRKVEAVLAAFYGASMRC